MDTVRCPRCSSLSEGKARRLQRGGFARCPNCNVGIRYESELLRENVDPISTYIPESCSVSPKTGRILCSHRVYKSGRFISYLFRKLSGHPNPKGQSRRRGTLKRDLTEL